MFSRFSPPIVAFGGSVLLLAGLLGALYFTGDDGGPRRTTEPLIIYCAEALRLPLTAIKEEYENDYGQKIELRIDKSQTLFTSLALTKSGDLFLPADDSYIQWAEDKGLVKNGDVLNVARMNAVVVVRPDFPGKVETWADFVAKGNKIGLANVEAAAISKLLKEELELTGRWRKIEERGPTFLGNVNEVFNSVHHVKSNDVGIVWDVIANPHQGAKIVRLKELENVQARVKVAIVSTTRQRKNAIHFVRYMRAQDKGAPHFEKQGYSDIERRGPMDERIELVVHAGAMLRPAIEEACREFAEREKVTILTKYDGCGLLVSQMKTGDTPDLFFACDVNFMGMVNDRFEKPINVSSNQLVIVVKKGNPKKVANLDDLAQPGLRLGVGHEQNCALGALTKETFVTARVGSKVHDNVKMTAPTGDNLVNAMRAGSLDVVIAYRSNVQPYLDELDAIPVTGIKCAEPAQPIAVSKSTSHPDLSKRLAEFLRSRESRERFERLGFGWELKGSE